MDGILPIILAALGIGLLIFIHEAGHYLAARAAGVHVEIFSLGFGTRLIGWQHKGTDYRISMVPLGGYVQVAGMDRIDRAHMAPDELHSKSFLARTFFYSGGVAMNLLFAIIAFPIIFKSGVDFVAPVVGRTEIASPAWQAGFRPGDRILSVNGKEMYSFSNLTVEIALAGRDPIRFEIERDGQRLELEVEAEYSDALGVFAIGITPALANDAPVVKSVKLGSPAQAAGMLARDRIVEVAGEPLRGEAALNAVRDLRQAATEIALTVERDDGSRHAVRYTPTEVTRSFPRIGVENPMRRVRGLRTDPTVAALGLAVGDEILSLDGRPLSGSGLDPYLDRDPGPMALRVLRDGNEIALNAAVESADAMRGFVDAVGLGPPRTGVPVYPASGGAALAAGVLPGDEVVAVAGAPVADWSAFVEAVRDLTASEPASFRIRRGADEVELSIQPVAARDVELGFEPEFQQTTQLYRVDTTSGAIEAGFVASVDLIKSLYVTLKKLFTGDVSARNLGGIIQISRVSYHYARTGWAEFVYFLALLSINLGFINILPIPVLDGGHLMFLLIEKVKGSPVSARVHGYSQVLGLVFVIALMVFVTYNDILKLL